MRTTSTPDDRKARRAQALADLELSTSAAILVRTAQRDTVAPVVAVATTSTRWGIAPADLYRLRKCSRLSRLARIRRLLGDTDIV